MKSVWSDYAGCFVDPEKDNSEIYRRAAKYYKSDQIIMILAAILLPICLSLMFFNKGGF